jgi:hypothetical protein
MIDWYSWKNIISLASIWKYHDGFVELTSIHKGISNDCVPYKNARLIGNQDYIMNIVRFFLGWINLCKKNFGIII